MADQYAPFDPNGGTAPVVAPPAANQRVASPGISGAIKDAVAAISAALAPKALTDRSKRVDKAVNDDSGDLGSQFK